MFSKGKKPDPFMHKIIGMSYSRTNPAPLWCCDFTWVSEGKLKQPADPLTVIGVMVVITDVPSVLRYRQADSALFQIFQPIIFAGCVGKENLHFSDKIYIFGQRFWKVLTVRPNKIILPWQNMLLKASNKLLP